MAPLCRSVESWIGEGVWLEPLSFNEWKENGYNSTCAFRGSCPEDRGSYSGTNHFGTWWVCAQTLRRSSQNMIALKSPFEPTSTAILVNKDIVGYIDRNVHDVTFHLAL